MPQQDVRHWGCLTIRQLGIVRDYSRCRIWGHEDSKSCWAADTGSRSPLFVTCAELGCIGLSLTHFFGTRSMNEVKHTRHEHIPECPQCFQLPFLCVVGYRWLAFSWYMIRQGQSKSFQPHVPESRQLRHSHLCHLSGISFGRSFPSTSFRLLPSFYKYFLFHPFIFRYFFSHLPFRFSLFELETIFVCSSNSCLSLCKFCHIIRAGLSPTSALQHSHVCWMESTIFCRKQLAKPNNNGRRPFILDCTKIQRQCPLKCSPDIENWRFF